MQGRIWRLASAAVVVLSLGFAGCDSTAAVVTAGNLVRPTAVAGLNSTKLVVVPVVLLPQFVYGPVCGARAAFVTNLSVSVTSSRDLFFRGAGFEFVDPFGVRSLPSAVRISSAALPSAGPVPVPVPVSPLPPVTVPSYTSLGGLPILSGTPFNQPFSLHFGCGIVPTGTLVVFVETIDRRGVIDLAQTTVAIGER
jgi:hypothetical protein